MLSAGFTSGQVIPDLSTSKQPCRPTNGRGKGSQDPITMIGQRFPIREFL